MTKAQLYTLTGFFIAPLVVAFCMALLTPVANDGPITPLGMLNNDIGALFGLTFAFYVLALPMSAVLAVPAYAALKFLNVVRWWSTLAAGAAIGLLCAFALTFNRLLHTHDIQLELRGYLTWGVVGALGASVFWLIWRRGQRTAD